MQAGGTHPEEELQQQSKSFLLLLLYEDEGKADCSKASSTESNPK